MAGPDLLPAWAPAPARWAVTAVVRPHQMWAIYVGGTLAFSALVLLVGPGSGLLWHLLWESVPISGLVAMVAGIRWYRPANPAAWWLMCAGLLVWTIADLSWTILYRPTGMEPVSIDLTQALYLMSYPLFAVGLARLPGRDCRRDLNSALDAAVVASGLCLFAWSLLLDTLLHDSVLGATALIGSVVYSLLPIVLVFFCSCDLGQGYLYGRPMPGEDLERLLATAADRSPRPSGPQPPAGMDTAGTDRADIAGDLRDSG